MEKDCQLLSTFGCTENGGSQISGAQSTVGGRIPLNNFVFNGVNYLQKKGCATRTNCPPLTQTFLWESSKKHIFIPRSRTDANFTCATSTTYSLYGLTRRATSKSLSKTSTSSANLQNSITKYQAEK